MKPFATCILPQEAKIRYTLSAMGILPTCKGYYYLYDAVSELCSGNALAPKLYRQIAQAHNVSTRSVSSAIHRTLIRAQQIDPPLYREVIAPDPTGALRPSAFILLLMEWLNCHDIIRMQTAEGAYDGFYWREKIQ